ncbi:MAG: hypothetical protein INR68_02470 [Methylobacterium mesophilicum]|nr:hypothetical protein [Methylobacterium mesophilicum]
MIDGICRPLCHDMRVAAGAVSAFFFQAPPLLARRKPCTRLAPAVPLFASFPMPHLNTGSIRDRPAASRKPGPHA